MIRCPWSALCSLIYPNTELSILLNAHHQFQCEVFARVLLFAVVIFARFRTAFAAQCCHRCFSLVYFQHSRRRNLIGSFALLSTYVMCAVVQVRVGN